MVLNIFKKKEDYPLITSPEMQQRFQDMETIKFIDQTAKQNIKNIEKKLKYQGKRIIKLIVDGGYKILPYYGRKNEINIK